MTRPRVIVFDGLDGCGKGTQLDKLSELLLKHNVSYTRTREPGGCPEAEKIRKFLLSKEGARLSARDQFDLFWQARELHINEKILPALAKGEVVLCDRFDSSTFAFQVYGEGRRELETLFYKRRNEVVTRVLGSDVKYIILDLPAEVAYRRMQNDYKRSPTHFDLKPLSYHDRVWQGFHQFKSRYGSSNVSLINANRTIDEVHRAIVAQYTHFTQ